MPFEWALEEALLNGHDMIRLQALVLLVKVRAPRSVDGQWRTLGELKLIDNGPLWRELLCDIEACFHSAQLLREIRRDPPEDRHDSGGTRWHWAVRAAGVTDLRETIPRLRELACSSNLDASLTAQRTLVDFEGPEANEALARCVLAWNYDASDRAADALIDRDPERLLRTLREMGPPKDGLYRYAILLGRLRQPDAVPLLCRTVSRVQIIDHRMFSLIRELARPEDRKIVEALPRLARDDQRQAAEQVVRDLLADWGLHQQE